MILVMVSDMVLVPALVPAPAFAQFSYQNPTERTVLCDMPIEIASGKKSSKAYPYFKRSTEFFIAKYDKQALAAANQALTADARFAPAYLMRGYINADLEQTEASLADFDRAIKLEPSLRTVNLCDVRSKLYIDSEKWQLAINDLSQSIIMQPMPWRYKMRGEVYATSGSNDLALRDFDSAIKLTPKSSGLYRTRADFYTTQKRYKEAIADYCQAIKFAPDDPSLYGARANAYEKAGRHDLAAVDRAKSSEEARATAF